MSTNLTVLREIRQRWYFVPLLFLTGLGVVMLSAWLLDSRRLFDVATVNVGLDEITEAQSELSNRYIGVGYLKYGSEAFYSGVFFKPPRKARVTWRKGEQKYDRSTLVLGTIPRSYSDIKLPQLLVEIDSDCNRVRVSWKANRDEVFLASAYKHKRRDCSTYADWQTPEGSPSGPLN